MGVAERGHSVKLRTADEAAGVLSELLEDHDLTLYEYFLTDLVAHRGTREQRFEQAVHVEALTGRSSQRSILRGTVS